MDNKIYYYYNPLVIDQLSWQSGKKKKIEEDIELGTAIKPEIGAEASIFNNNINADITGEASYKKTNKYNYSDNYYIVDTLKHLEKQSLTRIIEVFPHINVNAIYQYDGEITLNRKYDQEFDKWFIEILFTLERYIFRGMTSLEYWTSKSLLSELLLMKKTPLRILFKFLQISDSNIQHIQIISIIQRGYY